VERVSVFGWGRCRMFRWIFSQDTKQSAEMLVILIVACIGDLNNKGIDGCETRSIT
jgi:hypothetical protein